MGIWDLINKLRSACRTAAEENVVPAVNEYVHDEEGRARIARRATSFARIAAGYVFRVGLTWVPGGTLMYDIVKEGLKDEPPLPNSNANKKSKQTVAVEEMQAKMEKMQEEMNTTTQQSKILIEKMQQEMNTVKQEMNTIKQEMNTIRSRL